MPTYNFTVSQFTFTEAVTDAVYAGNMVSGGTMTITPNSGYVVSASSFSAAGTLPGQFASISFSDTAVAGEVDNTVLVTFTFSALFEMTSELENINLPISGHADLLDDKRRISIDFDFIDNTTENLNGATTLTQAAGITKDPSIGEPSADSNGLKTTNFSGTIDAENSIHVATVILERNPTGFHFNDNATISVENAPSSANFSLQHVSTAATNSEGQATHLQYGS